jgi:cytochrome c553
MQKKVVFLLAGLLAFCGSPRAEFKYFSPLPEDTAGVPLLLSQIGLYADIAAKQVTSEAVPFEVNSPLWSDDSKKMRWIILRPNRSILYDDTVDRFDYPDSTVLVKTFLNDRVQGDSTTRFYTETRLLVNKQDSGSERDIWYGYSYCWRGDQSDAVLKSRSASVVFDTAFLCMTQDHRLTYKKWTFPSQATCAVCHRVSLAGSGSSTIYSRDVLAFFPVQLKRMASRTIAGQPNSDSNYNQINYLFDRGVFHGTQPTEAQLSRRWKGMQEALPPVSSPDERFKAIDNMSRSYLASNCSGCHGVRGIATHSMGPQDKNWDFYQLKPIVEFSDPGASFSGLNDTTRDTSALWEPVAGRQHLMLSVQKSGIEMTPGTPWDMALPPGDPASLVPPLAVYPGYPCLSIILYKQWARNTPLEDSGRVYRDYMSRSVQDPPDSIAVKRLTWMFALQWGSQSWHDSLTQHGLTLDSVIPGPYVPLSMSMPPLASYLPDTAALRILGEWAKNYRPFSDTVQQSVRNKLLTLKPAAFAFVRGRMLFIPSGAVDEVSMTNIAGQTFRIRAIRRGVFALPRQASSGVYFFKIGTRLIKSSLY